MQLISKPKELKHILHMSSDWPLLNSFSILWVCSNTVFFHDTAQYMYFGDPYDAILQVDVQLGVAQSLQHNFRMTFVQLNLTQSVLDLTMSEHIFKFMRRLGTVWTHRMSDHSVKCR